MVEQKQSNTGWDLNFQIKHAFLGCAHEKLKENSTSLLFIRILDKYKFRLQFEYKTVISSKETVKFKTSQKDLKATNIEYDNESILFTNVNIDNGVIMIRMLIGNTQTAKRFKNTDIFIKNLRINRDDTVTWYCAANSHVMLTYRLYRENMQGINGMMMNFYEQSRLQNDKDTEHDRIEQEMKFTCIKDKIDMYEKSAKKISDRLVTSNTTVGLVNKAIETSYTRVGTISTHNNSMQSMNNNTATSYVEIDSVSINDFSDMNNFCEGFFLASFSHENGQVIENSDTYTAPCQHKRCSGLPAMEAEILYRFPLEDTKNLELNNLAASICFPSGIKVCYDHKANPITSRNYSTQITSAKGERFYMMSYHYYQKMDIDDYNHKYAVHPLKIYLRKFAENYIDILDINPTEKMLVEKRLAECTELGYSELVYVPFCLVLISKYPYIKQMETCLNSIFKLIVNCKDIESIGNTIGNIVSSLIYSIPAPHSNSKLMFYLPQEINPIEIEGPVFKDKSFKHINYSLLLAKFSIDKIITIYRLMLFEEKLLFVGNDYNELSQISEAFIALLFPIEWINTYIPIMSDKMTRILQTYLPFLNCIHENLMAIALSSSSEAEEGIYIISITKGIIRHSLDLKNENLSLNIPELPHDTQERLRKDLMEITYIKNKTTANLCIRNCFLEAFSRMFHDFMNYFYAIEDFTVFDTTMLLDNRDKSEHAFYKDVTETQLFITFIQNISKNEEDYLYFTKILNNIKSNDRNACLTRFTSTTNETDVINSYMKYYTIKTVYIIKTPIGQKVTNENQNNSIPLKDINKVGKASHSIINNEYFSNEKIIRENNRITLNQFKLDKEDFSKTYMRYVIQSKTDQSDYVKKRSHSILKRAEYFRMIDDKNKIPKPTFLAINKKEYELTEKEKDNIKDIIKDTLSDLFRSKALDPGPAIQELYRDYGREFFCKLVFQTNSVKQIKPDCFNQLMKLFLNGLISMCNINETDKTLECSVQLTKSSFYYRKGLTEELICDELKMKLKDYFLWVKDSFWIKWISLDIKSKYNNKTILNDNNTNDNEEMNYVVTLEDMCEKMLRLQINKEYILKFIQKMLEKYITKFTLIDDIQNKLNQVVAKYKYIDLLVSMESKV